MGLYLKADKIAYKTRFYAKLGVLKIYLLKRWRLT